MADVLRQLYREVTSLTNAAVSSTPVHVGGNPFAFRFDGSAHTATPPAVTLQISHDKLNWYTAHRDQTPAATGSQIDDAVESGYEVVLERPKWSRFQVAQDAEGARVYQGVWDVYKQE